MDGRAPIALGFLFGAVLSACGGVSELGAEPDALVTIRARLTAPIPTPASGFTSLRAGLMWAGVPVFVPYCFEYGTNPLKPLQVPSDVAELGCRDPFLVAPGLVGPSVAIDPESTSFEIPIVQLPSAEVLIGTREQRIAYASVVVFDDRDGDGELDLSRGCGQFGDSGRGRETIYAASFSDLNERQTRISYVEGAFDQDSYFYPHPQCRSLPPEGFSIWEVDEIFAADSRCEVHPIDEELELEPSLSRELRHLSCVQRSRESFPRPPRMREPDEDEIWECTKDGALAIANPECPCPEVRLFTLVGCYDELDCEKPDWDRRDTPPEWWPCELPNP